MHDRKEDGRAAQFARMARLLRLRAPDDMHIHLRDGDVLEALMQGAMAFMCHCRCVDEGGREGLSSDMIFTSYFHSESLAIYANEQINCHYYFSYSSPALPPVVRRGVVMPNLRPPVATTAQVRA